MYTKTVLSLLMICMVNALSLLAGPSNKHFMNGEKWVPKDFDPKNTTLLIQNFPGERKADKKQNQEMMDFMKENYPYAYEFADNISDAKYADAHKYPYALIFGLQIFGEKYVNGVSHTLGGITWDVYDRKNKVFMPPTNRASSFPIGDFSMTINTMLYIYDERNKK